MDSAVMLIDAGGTPRENNRMFPFGKPWLAFAASNNTEKVHHLSTRHCGLADKAILGLRFSASNTLTCCEAHRC
jgi:hypothetical protein